MKKNALLFFISLISFVSVCGQVKFAPIYTDNMVIKQNAEVPIWGSARAAENLVIIASWAPKDTIRTTASPSGRWSAVLKTPQADMVSHTIRCNGTKISNVMLGEVWLCSGQSNMEWSVNHGILNGAQEAMDATYPNIRIFNVPMLGASTPQLSMDAAWSTSTPETMRRASAVGYFFARKLHKELGGVPIGFISSAWGGTAAEPWIPIEKFDEKMMSERCTDANPWRPVDPAETYNQMIHPLVPFTLSGAIWYQGETNRLWAKSYDAIMQALIGSWRERFRKADLPFYFVQIAPFNYNNNKDTYSAELREAQELTAATVPCTGMVVVSDLVNDVNNIHPINKQDVGARLAAYALAEVYSKPISDYKSPTYKSISINGNIVTVSFNNPTAAIHCSGERVEGFTIAGADGKFVAAEAAIKGDKVEVWSAEVKKPTAVRYCFDDTTLGNLKSDAALPVAPFRSDRKF